VNFIVGSTALGGGYNYELTSTRRPFDCLSKVINCPFACGSLIWSVLQICNDSIICNWHYVKCLNDIVAKVSTVEMCKQAYCAYKW